MRIDHLLWDRGNIAEAARHGLRPDEVDEMVYFETWVYRTNPRYPGQIKLIGYTPSGRWLTVPMEPTGTPGIWRPATAWPSTVAEMDLFQARRR